MSEDWKAAYPVGCRVEVDVEAWTARLGRKPRLRPPYTGTVVGHSRVDHGHLWLRLDGRRWPYHFAYSVACVRRLTEPEEAH